MTKVEVVVIFGIFGAIGSMVLLKSPERIKLESCSCAHIKAFEEWNEWLRPDDDWDLSDRGRNVANLVIYIGLACPAVPLWLTLDAYL